MQNAFIPFVEISQSEKTIRPFSYLLQPIQAHGLRTKNTMSNKDKNRETVFVLTLVYQIS